MQQSIKDRVRLCAESVAKLNELPVDFHHPSVSYLFIHFTGSKWWAELIIDPFHLDQVPIAWKTLVDELNANILPFVPATNSDISGYYPILLDDAADINAPFMCLRMGIDVPDMHTHTDAIDLQLLQQLVELTPILTQLGLDSIPLLQALENDAFAIFAYLCQLVLLGLLPLKELQYSTFFPRVVDDGMTLRFDRGVGCMLEDVDPFLHVMNDVFFQEYYQGYTYLSGTYPFTKSDALNCQQRTLNDGSHSYDPTSWFNTNAVAKRYYMYELVMTLASATPKTL
jgi:hypothetical protein